MDSSPATAHGEARGVMGMSRCPEQPRLPVTAQAPRPPGPQAPSPGSSGRRGPSGYPFGEMRIRHLGHWEKQL